MTVEGRIAELVTLLKSNRRVTRRDLQVRWECVPLTVHRTIARAREKGYRIEARRGYYYLLKESSVEVPYLVLGAGELAALLGLTHWLEVLGSGVLKSQLAPIRARLESDLGKHGLELAGWKERICQVVRNICRTPTSIRNPDFLGRSGSVRLRRAMASRSAPDSSCRWSLEPEIPLRGFRELARDVMRYADEVEVVGPEDLQLAVDKMIHRAAKNR